MPAPGANFEGVSNVDGVLPPDTQGDIGFDPATGKKYYVQWVNLSVNIWEVTNPAAPALLLGPIPGNAIWSGSGTICQSNNDGDPITLYDHLANRWLISQFALPNYPTTLSTSASPFPRHPDPTGAWYRYAFKISDTKMNDYPKFGVWPDGYYMTVNQFTTQGWGGAGVVAFDRTKMLAGDPAARSHHLSTAQSTPLTAACSRSDLDGPLPPPRERPTIFCRGG